MKSFVALVLFVSLVHLDRKSVDALIPHSYGEPQAIGVCDNCLMTNGVGYVPHPDCSHYYQCYYDNNEQTSIRAVERKCSFGLFWNQKILSCDFPQNVPCSKDICFNTRPQPMVGNCRGFWDCKSGSPSAQCCPLGYSYNAQYCQCVPDMTCRDVCTSKDVGAIICQKLAVPDKRYYNQWTQSGWVIMPCAPFTAFNPNTCGCSERIISQAPACVPEVYLPFDRSTDDQSDRKVHVENNGVKVSNGVAYFDGKGSLKINRFSNGWYGSTVIITIRYKVIDNSCRRVLICNGDCDEHPTLFIGSNPDGVEFYAKTEDNIMPVNFTIASSNHGYQTATYILDGGKLMGQVGYGRYYEPTKGNLQTTTKALTIGGCGTSENFKGYIDEIAIYLCKPPTVY
ncbi:protein PIF-like isoform X2 [Gigantopelta aegis]|uniref:protein PIF-like isoform X2 n=1 Tax=Gigantopelta aegis TaxID=1735272 RepID=UPI001B888D48|nr:protein PIF-like isoform X2 [Gigantopelta aegis]